MARRISIGLGLVIAAALTHGMVYSGINLESSRLMPSSTYQGFFAHVLVGIWGAWGQANGLEPMSHVEEFGRFYTYFVLLSCPLIGFGVFWLIFRKRIGGQLWKPLAIAIVFATPLQELIRQSFRTLGLDEPAAEAARAVIVLLFMIWSIGVTWPSRWRPKAFEFPIQSSPLP